MVRHRLRRMITGRYFRFHPVTWHGWISMRVELYGCVVGECESLVAISLSVLNAALVDLV